MGRNTKEINEKRLKLNVTIENEVMHRLNAVVEERMVVKSKFVNMILREFLDGLDDEKAQH